MHTIRLLAVGVCLSTAGMARAGAEAEEAISIDRLPKTVAEAVKRHFPEAKIVSASKESEVKQTLYEVSLTQAVASKTSKEASKTQRIDVLLTTEGEIKEIEKEIAEKDLPIRVETSLKEKYPDASLRKIEAISKMKDEKEVLESFEVLLIAADKSTLEVKFSAQEKEEGKVLKVEKKSDKEDDGDADQDEEDDDEDKKS
ncbi:PepSY-like domain-containing protein [bacterium]|nr:PepSY-like domain-containing protein [bacterium]